MPLRASRTSATGQESYEARLARTITQGGPGATAAAMTLLEHCDPPTLQDAIALLGNHLTVSQDAFDHLADAWETYRHIKHQYWD